MFKEIVKALGEKGRERKEKMRILDEDMRIQKLIEERQKPSNERELERYMEEDRQKEVKRQLDFYRKKRDDEINYGHNPLKVKNITNKSDYNLLKQKNLFNGKNMFSHQGNIIKDNPKLLNNGKLGLCRR